MAATEAQAYIDVADDRAKEAALAADDCEALLSEVERLLEMGLSTWEVCDTLELDLAPRLCE